MNFPASIQGAALMAKFGVNVPEGVVVSSKGEVAKVLKEHFPKETEVARSYFCFVFNLTYSSSSRVLV